MRHLWVLLLTLFLFGFFNSADASRVPPTEFSIEKLIRVRIARDIPLVTLSGLDLEFSQASARGPAGLQKDGFTHWLVDCSGQSVRAKSKQSGKVVRFGESLEARSPAGFLTFHKRVYRNSIQVFPRGEKCDVVNKVSIERYLDGLVNAEFSARWDPKAVAAQVIAARTYALHSLLRARKKNLHYDVESTVRDQVYDGPALEDFRSSRIVKQTKGIVLATSFQGNPYPIKAFYHSTCGGRTELPQNVWGKRFPGFFQTVQCPFCRPSPRFNWKLKLDATEIRRRILKGQKVDLKNLRWPRYWKTVLKKGRLVDLEIDRNLSRRAPEVRSVWEVKLKSGKKTRLRLSIPSNTFRHWLGTSRLKSTAFAIVRDKKPDQEKTFTFYGRGNGHGVGMCQWGAKGMGEKGYSSVQILKHYYPDAVLKKMW